MPRKPSTPGPGKVQNKWDAENPRKQGTRKGAVADIMQRANEAVKDNHLLPHEWLLKISRGEPILHRQWSIQYDDAGNEIDRKLVDVDVYPDFLTRIDCAKAAAPYFAPKLSSQKVSLGEGINLADMSEEELDKEINTLLTSGDPEMVALGRAMKAKKPKKS